MSYQEEWDAFLAKCGGRNNFVGFINELYELESRNPVVARDLKRIAEVLAEEGAELGDVAVRQFQGTPLTHSLSTADDFFKAKSPEYLQAAERHHEQDEASRNNEEGWPYSDLDIGDADDTIPGCEP